MHNSRFFFFFYNILTALRTVSNTYAEWHNRVQTTRNTSGVHPVQHVVCRMLRRDSSAIKFDRVEVKFALALF